MSDSSAQPDYLTTLSDTIVFDTTYTGTYTGAGAVGSSTDTITITGGGSSFGYGAIPAISTYSIGTGSTITIGGGGAGSTILGGLDTSTFTFNVPEEFVNCFPDWHRIENMCKEYPGLQIAFEKFKTTYRLVKDDYDTPKDKK
jgi:hypothetical protein